MDELNVLLYRQKTTKDPCACGIFGIAKKDCMGQQRDWNYNAIIGIGGVSAKAVNANIDRKLTWVGINAHKKPVPDKRGRLVTFDHICVMKGFGPKLCYFARGLYDYMFECQTPKGGQYISHAALSSNLPDEIRTEVLKLVDEYRKCPPSLAECQCGIESTPECTPCAPECCD